MQMKKILVLFLAAIAAVAAVAGVSSCGGGELPGDSEDLLIGDWQCYKADYGQAPDGILAAFIEGNRFYLKDDGTYRIDMYFIEEGTWSKDGKKLTLVSRDRTSNIIIEEVNSRLMYCYQFYSGYVFKFYFCRM